MSTTGILQETGTVLSIESGDDLAKEFDTYRNEVLADSPVGYWRFNDATSASSLAASVGSAMTVTAGSVVTATGALVGDADAALTPSGTTRAEATGVTTVAASMECWYRAPSSTPGATHQFILGWRDDSDAGEAFYLLHLGLQANIEARARVAGAATTLTFAIPLDGAWHHLVLVWDGTDLRPYLDGAAQTTGGRTGTRGTATRAFGVFSEATGNNPDTRSVDEVAIYSSALSAARIGVHYAAGVNL